MLRLKFERQHKQLSQADVARLAKIPQPTLSLIELGRLSPTAEQLARLASVFDVKPTELLRDVAVLRLS